MFFHYFSSKSSKTSYLEHKNSDGIPEFDDPGRRWDPGPRTQVGTRTQDAGGTRDPGRRWDPGPGTQVGPGTRDAGGTQDPGRKWDPGHTWDQNFLNC